MTSVKDISHAPPNPLVAAIRQVTDAGYVIEFQPGSRPRSTRIVIDAGNHPFPVVEVTHESIDVTYIPASHIFARHIERIFNHLQEGDSHASSK